MILNPTNLLIILDGWGYSPYTTDNAIKQGHTPCWDSLRRTSPQALLTASGNSVGLPHGQMGNSEVGHMTIGAGRIIEQDLTRIDRQIDQGVFNTHPVLRNLPLTNRKIVHVIGLLSPGGVHSHEAHIAKLIEALAERNLTVCLHAILDGRDTPPKSARTSIEKFVSLFKAVGRGQIGSIVGRYYAMDRDHRWERTQAAYDLYSQGSSQYKDSDPLIALEKAYERGETDEFVSPTWIDGGSLIEDDDAVVFMNFRADRMRQICRAFLLDVFSDFERKRLPKLSSCILLTPYADDLSPSLNHVPLSILFEPVEITNTLGECFSAAGKTQLRIAETEKYAHVTYFFSGGNEREFENEHRKFIASPSVATYDQQPEMSIEEITTNIVSAVRNSSYDLIVANFANGDMVGHTGNFDAAKTACEAVDKALEVIVTAVFDTDSNCLITADHGNVECLIDKLEDQPHTAHTLNPVPLLYVGNTPLNLKSRGTLADIAPTLLNLAKLEVPFTMTGNSLLI